MSLSDRLLEGGADLSSMGGCSSAARIVSVINSRTGEVPLGGRHVRGVGAPTAPPLHSHGHVDHVGGTAPFDAEEMRPTVVAREAIAARFDRYRATAGYNSRINQRQFTAPGLTWPTEYRYPDRTYRDRVTLRRGELTFELEHARGETDDHTRVWVPELVDRALDDTARLLETLCRQTHGAGPCCRCWSSGSPAPAWTAMRPPRTWPRWSCACWGSHRTTHAKSPGGHCPTSPSPSGSPRHPLGPSVAAVFGWSWASGWPRVG
ncbi:hypothetical protein K8Z49_36685 [Actinomadura madurae]